MAEKIFNVLFLCTGNSARSIIAESALNHLGKGRFKAYSAGSYPSGEVNPLVLAYLNKRGICTDGARSKSWDEFSGPDAPKMDLVITVCDDAAGEVCPIWPGQPITAHWGVEDPARFMDDEEKANKVIQDTFRILSRRIQLLLALPSESLDRIALTSAVREIGSQT